MVLKLFSTENGQQSKDSAFWSDGVNPQNTHMAGHAALHFSEKDASFSFGLSEAKNMLVVYYERPLIHSI